MANPPSFAMHVLCTYYNNLILTSIMWPSQNFHLYNGTIIKIKVNESINNLKKYVTSAPYPRWGYIQLVQIITI